MGSGSSAIVNDFTELGRRHREYLAQQAANLAGSPPEAEESSVDVSDLKVGLEFPDRPHKPVKASRWKTERAPLPPNAKAVLERLRSQYHAFATINHIHWTPLQAATYARFKACEFDVERGYRERQVPNRSYTP